MTNAEGRLRIDKWLWHARLVKSRSLAVEVISAGQVRVNGQRIEKPGRAVGPGDVLTVALNGQVRVLRIRAIGNRRGPATEALTLYDDLDAPAVPAPGGAAERPF